MAINLIDIAIACDDYINTHLTTIIENLVADVPNAISPGEGFKFDLRVDNTGDIRLIKVKYFVSVTNPSVASLVVPSFYVPHVKLARAGRTIESEPLAPGSHVSAMYLFPAEGDNKVLEPGETDVWRNLRGVGNSLGTAHLIFRVLAQVDPGFLFAQDNESPTAKKVLNVV